MLGQCVLNVDNKELIGRVGKDPWAMTSIALKRKSCSSVEYCVVC